MVSGSAPLLNSRITMSSRTWEFPTRATPCSSTRMGTGWGCTVNIMTVAPLWRTRLLPLRNKPFEFVDPLGRHLRRLLKIRENLRGRSGEGAYRRYHDFRAVRQRKALVEHDHTATDNTVITHLGHVFLPASAVLLHLVSRP